MSIYHKTQNLVQSKSESFTRQEKNDLKVNPKDSTFQNLTMKLPKKRKQSKKPSLFLKTPLNSSVHRCKENSQKTPKIR